MRLFLLAFITLTSSINCFAHVAPQVSDRLSSGIIFLDAEYDADSAVDLQGTILFTTYKTSLTNSLSLGGGLGLMTGGKIGGVNKASDGGGFSIYLDTQYLFKKTAKRSYYLTGSFNHDRFIFAQGQAEVLWSSNEVKLAGLVIQKMKDGNIYGGLEAFLVSNGVIEYQLYPINTQENAQRKIPVNLRFGVSLGFIEDLDFRLDILLLSEQTITLGIDYVI